MIKKLTYKSLKQSLKNQALKWAYVYEVNM